MPDANLITTEQVGTPIEVLHTYTFQKNVDALLDIMGITQPIRRVPGTVLKTKKVVGTLESGDVAEGEEIPISKYQIVEKVYDTIDIEKYAKQITLEAINDDPSIVELTNEEFCADIQNKIQDKFYAMLLKGSLTGHAETFQASIAKAIGLVKDKFKKMRRTPTGIAVWVNTIDLYDFLGAEKIDLATQFGFEYAKNFLGADICFISSDIPEKTVIATPLNNLKCYYVDPTEGAFTNNGLVYTKWGDTGYVALHSQPCYDNATIKMYALCGLRLFAEYLDGISYISIGNTCTQTMSTLSVKSVAGQTKGTTKLTINPKRMAMNGQYFVEAVDGTKITAPTTIAYGTNMTAKANFTLWDGKSEIPATENKPITVVETDETDRAVAVGVVAKAVVAS